MSDQEKILRRVRAVSGVNGWSVAVVGGLGALLTVFFGGWFGFLIGLAVTASGMMELTGRSKLKIGSREAGRWLTASQLWLLFVIVLYAAVQLAGFDSENALSNLPPELQRVLMDGLQLDARSIRELFTKVFYALYVSVILVSFLYQGGLWLFYKKSAAKLQSSLPTSE